jgi:dTDP-4-amino-4,6-dideoxygalactose transaminase
MEFRDLKRQYAAVQKEMDMAVRDAIADGVFIMGQRVAELETRLAAYVGAKHCITCASGTDALTLALKAMSIGAGDAVFVPDFTFFATAEAVALEGATPIFVDVREDTFNIDVQSLETAVARVKKEGCLKPKAIIAVDLFGQPADYDAIREVARRYDLKIIEDGAQGFGGRIGNRRACSFGDIATTSFFPAKPLGCYGDGGAVFTDNDEWAAVMVSLRVHGKGSNKYDNVRIGLNSRLDTLQAAVLKVKMDAFEKWELQAVQDAAASYTKHLEGVVATPVVPEGYYSSWAQYTIRLSDQSERDAVKSALSSKGIPTGVYYPRPLHLQPAFSHLPQNDPCPVATRVCTQVLSLPMHPYLTSSEINEVCGTICDSLIKE